LVADEELGTLPPDLALPEGWRVEEMSSYPCLPDGSFFLLQSTNAPKLGNDIEAFRAEASQQMAAEGERIRQETAAHIKRVEEQSALEIETAGKVARRELKQYSAELALKLAEERVRTRMDANSESGLVDSFVAELGRKDAFSKERTN